MAPEPRDPHSGTAHAQTLAQSLTTNLWITYPQGYQTCG